MNPTPTSPDSAGYTVTEIARIVKGKLFSERTDQRIISDLLIDSRNFITSEHSLFVALVSKRNDAHKYIPDLYRNGMRNFLITRLPDNPELLPQSNFILVNNTLNALQALAAFHRSKFNIPVIGITGSNGKTIVKEWLFQLLSRNRRVVRSPKSFNSQIGVPLSVWKMSGEHTLAIFEAGISETNEMEKLQPIIRPTIGIFTNIGHAHDENFINNVQKIGEKLKLFTKVEILVYCKDHTAIQEVILKTKLLESIRSFTWGYKPGVELLVKEVSKNEHHTLITWVYKEQKADISIPFTDDASVENAMHCLAVMLHLGYDIRVIREGMLQLHPVAMRLELKEGINNCSVINDSYNSDINSLSIAIDFLDQQKQHKKKTIILSDILQTGRNDNVLYDEIARLLARKSIHRIIGIGKEIRRQHERFNMEKVFFESTDAFLNLFPLSSFQNETILLKGARVFGFERISRALEQKAHETVLEIDLNALVHNLNYYRSQLKPGTRIMVMVKAFSYGSGSFEIANTLQHHRVDYLAVAYADEGVELRNAGITLPIMVMNPEEQSFDSIIKYGLEPEIYSFRVLWLLEESMEKSRTGSTHEVKIHIKVDTGMHRLGFEEDDMDELVLRLAANRWLKVQSLFSHLAASEDPAEDEFTRMQIGRLQRMGSCLESKTGQKIFLHILNSAGITRFPEACFDMVRLGIGLYGVGADEKEQSRLKNVSRLVSTISQLKKIKAGETIGYNRRHKAAYDMLVAVVGIGYADGLDRKLGNGRGKMLVAGKFVPIIGNICMDMCMIDVTGMTVNEGDEVVIFGETYTVSDMARDMETIPYEVLTGISRRVKRVYYQE